MSTMIEPTAGRLFDMYYRYNVKADLTALLSLTQEAYNLHERLCKLSEHKNGLLDLDEFLLITALGNYFVPQDDFLGKTYVVTDQFAKRNKLGLLRVCLVDKKTAHLAIDAELARENGGQEKVAKIQAQLVNFGDAFNIEPVIYNFMVKVYYKLANMRLSIPGKAYGDIAKSYRKELYNHDPHYLPLKSITASNDEILGNSTLLARLNIHEFDEELPPQFKDTFNEVSALDIDLSKLGAKEYSGDDYKLMHDLLFEKIISHANIFLITRYLPKHLGVAIISENKNNEPEIAPFDIQMQKAAFEAAAIQLDPAFYQTTCYELLVIFIFKGKICPVILSKTALFEFQSVVAKLQRVSAMKRESALTIDSLGEEPFELNINHEPIIRNGDKLSRNDPCPCGSGKKYKKCCLQ